MPEKDPQNWIGMWSSLPEPFRAALLSVLIAALRILYDDREPRPFRRLLEASLCGGLTLAIASGLEAMGVSAGWGTFAGGAVGLLGAEFVRSLAVRYGIRRATGK